MSENIEPQVILFGDLPRIESAEFGDYLKQWHEDHNGIKPDDCQNLATDES